MHWQRYTKPPHNRKLSLWQRLVQWQTYILLLTVLALALGAVTAYLHFSQAQTDSIAVLPFVYEAPAGVGSAYLAEGLTESLRQRLAQAASLKVSPPDTVLRDKGQELDAQEAESALGVRTVLSGRIIMQGGLLTVRARLLETRTRAVLWRYQATRETAELLVLQEEILSALARQLRLSEFDRQQLLAPETEKPQAFLPYLKGRTLQRQRSGEALKSSLEQFRQALALDPRYARAQAALAEAYLLAPHYGELAAPAAVAASKEAVTRALELDPQLAEAQVTLGLLLRKYEWDWAGAEEAFTRALALNDNNAAAHREYGELLTGLGRFDEAIAELQRARELAPASLPVSVALGAGFYYARRYDAALRQLRKALELDPAAAEIHAYLGLIYGQQGKPREALVALQKALTLAQGGNALAARLAHAYVLAEMELEARKILDDLQELAAPGSVPLTLAAAIRAALGEQEQALALLTQAVAAHEEAALWLKVDPHFDSLRAEPRFNELLQHARLD
jgi:serine/threonine-protein kinase